MFSTLASAAVLLTSVHASNNNAPFDSPGKPYSQISTDADNLLKYTGWQGPYTQRRGQGINRNPPASCRVDQVVHLGRHGERWPDHYDWIEQAGSLDKILANQGTLNGSLYFANWYEPYATDEYGYLNEESLWSPYSGLLDAYNQGVEARRRYYDLYDGSSILPIFASGYERVVDTARFFGKGFLNWNYTQLAALNIIPETVEMGSNTLVPTCNNSDYSWSSTSCDYPENTTESNSPWLYDEYNVAVARLNRENPNINLTQNDIPHLMGMAAFELNIRGSSPWANVFTSEEWIAFEYSQSSYYYCFSGPGSPTAKSMGATFVNASRALLLEGPENSLPLAFNFAHDINIVAILATLGIDEEESWDGNTVSFGHKFDITDITPQGARIVFERLICDEDPSDDLYALAELNSQYPAGAFNVSGNITADYASGHYQYNSSTNETITANSSNHKTGNENIYVRIVLNDAVVPLDGCTSGPGYSCKLSDYNDFVTARLANIPNFNDICNIQDAPAYLDFWWNYNTTTALDWVESVGSMEELVDSEDKPISE